VAKWLIQVGEAWQPRQSDSSARLPPNNQHLRELVATLALPPAVALTVFNRGLNPAVSESTWKALMAEPGQANLQAVTDEQLTHAQQQFAKVQYQSERKSA
jgi:hypothetical protein